MPKHFQDSSNNPYNATDSSASAITLGGGSMKPTKAYHSMQTNNLAKAVRSGGRTSPIME